MQTITISQQLQLDGTTIPIRRNVWTVPVHILRNMAEDDRIHCDNCYEEFFWHSQRNADYADYELYLSPWDEEGKLQRLCPECQYDRERNGRFEGEEDCGRCYRTIVDSNGMRSYFRIISCDFVCVSCLQEEMLSGDASQHEGRRYAGILYAWAFDWADDEDTTFPADFYNRDDLYRHGFEPLEELPEMDRPGEPRWSYYHCGSQSDVDRLRTKIRTLINDGFAVAVDQERTPIMGPVPVTLWVRDDWHQPEEAVIVC